MEDTNRPEGSVRVVWEVLPGQGEQIFQEITPEDLDLSLFSTDILVNTDNFPIIPYPLLNPADDYFDRLWTQTVIKINYHSGERSDGYGP